MQKLFSQISPNIINRLRITDEALFSTTPNLHANYILQHILCFYSNSPQIELIVTLAGSCIGGDILISYDYFKQINAVDISSLHCEITQHNIQTIYRNTDKLKIYNDNYLNLISKLKQHIVYLDPPWKGINYNKKDKTHMQLIYETDDHKSIDICHIINKLYEIETQMVLIKVPKNYDINNITKHNPLMAVYSGERVPVRDLGGLLAAVSGEVQTRSGERAA